MDNREYIVGIDIGSSNLVMAVGARNDDGSVSVLGVEVQDLEGYVKCGDIVNYTKLGEAITVAKKALENDLGITLNSAYVGISGKSVYCVRYEDYVDISNKTSCVTENELRELQSRIEMVASGGGDAVIDRIPLRYRINDNQDVTNPIGAYGRKLSATYLFVLVGKQQEYFVNQALYRAGMKVCGLCVNPTLLPQVLLNDAEQEDGVAIVDIGGDLTDISIVRDGKLWYFASLPIGASSINDDLQEFLRTSKKNVDPLKRKYGSAIASLVSEDITVPVKTAGNVRKQILKRNIAEISEERLKDIAGFVMRELKAAKSLSRIPCGVVLTGGSAYLENIDKLFARELNMEVRLGSTLNNLDYESQQSVCAFPQSAVVGLLLYGANHSVCETLPNRVPVPKAQPFAPKQPEPQNTDIFTPLPGGAVDKPVELQPKEEERLPEEPPLTQPYDVELVDKPSSDAVEQLGNSSTDIKEEQESQSQQGKLRSRWSKWVDTIRNKMDNMFPEDNYI